MIPPNFLTVTVIWYPPCFDSTKVLIYVEIVIVISIFADQGAFPIKITLLDHFNYKLSITIDKLSISLQGSFKAVRGYRVEIDN